MSDLPERSQAISTRNLAALPGIDELRRLCQSIAMLDAIIMPEWEYRYYSFNSRWGEGEMLASMRNGSGDEYYILFNRHGAIIKGFAHESAMAGYPVGGHPFWPGVLDRVPDEFRPFLAEPAISPEMISFCIWRRHGDPVWQIGDVHFPDKPDPDGSEDLLSILDGDPRTYQQWAEEYYERDLPLDPVEAIYAHRPLTDELVAQLNPDLTLADLADDITEIGYPATPGDER